MRRERSKSEKPETGDERQPLRDDFTTVARRIGCDEDKDRFEAKLKKIAKTNSLKNKS